MFLILLLSNAHKPLELKKMYDENIYDPRVMQYEPSELVNMNQIL